MAPIVPVEPVIPAALPAQPEATFTDTSVDLNTALKDLAELPASPGVDRQVFEQLKAELAKVLHYYYGEGDQLARKQSSGLAPTELNQPWCAEATVLPAGQITLFWRGRQLGDYDLNGEVNISDITPLGMFFRDNVTLDADGLPVVAADNEWKAQVDGDSNTELNIADITPIGVNFASRITGYRVYYGTLDAAGEVTWESDFIPNATDAGQPWTLPVNNSNAAGNVQRYTLAFNRPAPAAGSTGVVEIKSFDGATEGTGRMLVLNPGPHAPLGCGICHKLTDYTFRGPDATCKTCHATPPEDQQASWETAPGMHGGCLNCHNQHAFTITPAYAACGLCHSAEATAVAAAQMPDCLSCHEQPHLPNAQPATAQCAACHTDQAASLADEQMQDCQLCHNAHTFTQTYAPAYCQTCHPNPDGDTGLQWATAPGQHGVCSSCHTLHDFKLAQPNAVCANCHQAKLDDNHSNGNLDCLSCHDSPHLPQKPTGVTACVLCHTTPPNQPGKVWADAPGLHANCMFCHPGTHPDKPNPPEALCVNCHATLLQLHAPAGKTCADCHNAFYHVPDVTHGNAGCQLCHPVPPEDPAKAWTDAPGLHADCVLCHPGTHPDKPVPPESICLNCHQAEWAEKHVPADTACLSCHLWEHLPLPIELKPGLHLGHPIEIVGCTECHQGHGGGGMPDRDTCLECHADKEEHSSGQECGTCHIS